VPLGTKRDQEGDVVDPREALEFDLFDVRDGKLYADPRGSI
jgi:hypothetical protein